MLEFEGKPSDIILVIGGGKPFLNWIENCPQGKNVFCIDRDPNLPYISDPRFIRGDVFKLVSLCFSDQRLKGMPISTIHADFLLNAVGNEIGDRRITFADVLAKPALLLTNGFPVAVRKWFMETAHGTIDASRGDLRKIREILRQCALQQMWEVLVVGGEIVIVDRKEVIEWVADDAEGILPAGLGRVKITRSEINLSDRTRSSSLGKILSVWHEPFRNVGKICLEKLGVSRSVMSQEYHRGEEWY